jgi:hypothetical protein
MNDIVCSQQDSPVKVVDRRRSTRRLIRIPTTLADKRGLVNGVVTNISDMGCRLQLIATSFPSRYITLKLYPQNETPSVLITMAEIRWFENEGVGLGFVYVSQEEKAKLQRFLHRHITLGT